MTVFFKYIYKYGGDRLFPLELFLNRSTAERRGRFLRLEPGLKAEIITSVAEWVCPPVDYARKHSSERFYICFPMNLALWKVHD